MSAPPFERFLQTHKDDVYRYLKAVARSHADDCFQETFISALKAYPRLDHSGDARAWIFTIARRKALDAHRAEKRRPLPVDEVPERGSVIDHDGGDAELLGLVERLPPKQKEAVELRYIADLSYEQIAEVMGLTGDAARQNASAGIRALRKVWKT
ncbi:MAG: sigma-70 family RNA polymerase sigma factor [Actinomycetota bacterium]|nr:sigma-70 family RNA polymerase sigma factor [Actinomycetota bacterium]